MTYIEYLVTQGLRFPGTAASRQSRNRERVKVDKDGGGVES